MCPAASSRWAATTTYRGPDDPNHRWYHIGFRVARNAASEGKTVAANRTVGLFLNTPKACPGYTLFACRGLTFLIDMQGQVVHTWPIGTPPRFLANGHLLDAARDGPSGFQGFRELDWDGKTVWEHAEKRKGYAPHHDWVRIYNKALKAPTTLYIANYPGRINLNLPGRPVRRDWLHCNSIDYNAELGHIVTNSVQGEFYVIDHDGTFIAWIKPGLPGAGNFLIFNNGQYLFERTNQSSIMEVNGFLNATKRNGGRGPEGRRSGQQRPSGQERER